MEKINKLLTHDLFWIPILVGAGISWIFLTSTGGEQSVTGYGGWFDSLIALILIVVGAWIIIRGPGNLLKYFIGLGLLGFGLYIIIMGMV